MGYNSQQESAPGGSILAVPVMEMVMEMKPQQS